MTPSNSTLNKPIQGIVGTQKTLLNQQYSQSELPTRASRSARASLIANPAPGGNYFARRASPATPPATRSSTATITPA